MANIFRDGFDTYNGTGGGPTGLGVKFTTISSASLQTGRFGGQCIRMPNSGSRVSGPLSAATSSLMICCGVKMAILSGTASAQISFSSGTTFMVGIGFQNDGSVVAYRQTAVGAGTELGRSAAGVVVINNWYSAEARITISDTTGSVVVKVDGAEVLNLTNVDTRNGAPTTVDGVTFYGTTNSMNLDIDDVFITDQNAFLAYPVRIETLVPNADGATLNWTPSTGVDHYAVVDELPANSTDYLQASTVGDIDELDLSALSSTPLAIEEVCISGFLNKTDATARTAYLGVGSGGTNSQGSAFTLNQTGLKHERPLETDPNTSAAWGASAVNALKLRPEVAS